MFRVKNKNYESEESNNFEGKESKLGQLYTLLKKFYAAYKYYKLKKKIIAIFNLI